MRSHPLFRIWQGMKTRCENEKNQGYKFYGARGIKICEEWQNKNKFYEDMSPRPPGTQLDRIDVNGNYEKNNYRWVTAKQNSNNRRNNIKISYQGETKTLSEWADFYKLNYNTLFIRIVKNNWEIEKAFNTPNERSKAILINCFGKEKTIQEWANEIGVKFNVLYNRIFILNWNIEKALTKKGKVCLKQLSQAEPEQLKQPST